VADVGETLAHHQAERRRGRGVVSVLDRDDALVGAWRRWSEATGRTLITVRLDTAVTAGQAIARACLSALRDPLLDRIARTLGTSPERLLERSRFERQLVIDSLTSESVELAHIAALLLLDAPFDPVAFLRVIAANEPNAPAILVEVLDGAQLSPLFDVVENVPELPIALTGVRRATIKVLPDRFRAIAEWGWIDAPRLEPEALDRVVAASTPNPTAIAASVSLLDRLGCPATTIVDLARAHGAAVTTQSAHDEERVRSLVERFLVDVLDASEVLRDTFSVNHKIRCDFHDGTAEVDFVFRDSRIALEIDGWHHFRDQDQYRRDRRKDVALQLAGYLVIRVLAEDVTTRLPELLRQLEELHRARRL
jgi:very-short-patch-repair endonuclease